MAHSARRQPGAPAPDVRVHAAEGGVQVVQCLGRIQRHLATPAAGGSTACRSLTMMAASADRKR